MRGLRYMPLVVVNYTDDIVDEFGHRSRVETGRHTTWGSLQQQIDVAESITSERVASLYSVFLPPSEQLDAGDEIEVDGARYTVQGPPLHPRNSRGVHHVQAQLRYVGGVDTQVGGG